MTDAERFWAAGLKAEPLNEAGNPVPDWAHLSPMLKSFVIAGAAELREDSNQRLELLLKVIERAMLPVPVPTFGAQLTTEDG